MGQTQTNYTVAGHRHRTAHYIFNIQYMRVLAIPSNTCDSCIYWIEEETKKHVEHRKWQRKTKHFSGKSWAYFFWNKNLSQSILIKQGRPKLMFRMDFVCKVICISTAASSHSTRSLSFSQYCLIASFLTQTTYANRIEWMQTLNSYFILSIPSQNQKKKKKWNENKNVFNHQTYWTCKWLRPQIQAYHKVCLAKILWIIHSLVSTLLHSTAVNNVLCGTAITPYMHTIFITTNNNGYLCRPEISNKSPEEMEMIAPISKLYNFSTHLITIFSR